jgi:hypothetical protein
VGEKDARLYRISVDLSYPDIDANSKKLAMEILNGNCIMLVPTLTSEKNNPTYVMVGGHHYRTEVDSRSSSGDAPGAAKLEARANDMLSIRSGGGGAAAVGAGRNAIMDRRQTMNELEKIIKDEGMMYSDSEKKQAASEYRRLAMMNVNEGSGGGNAFTVTAGGKTYTFPTQEAANKFKAEAGVK